MSRYLVINNILIIDTKTYISFKNKGYLKVLYFFCFLAFRLLNVPMKWQ